MLTHWSQLVPNNYVNQHPRTLSNTGRNSVSPFLISHVVPVDVKHSVYSVTAVCSQVTDLVHAYRFSGMTLLKADCAVKLMRVALNCGDFLFQNVDIIKNYGALLKSRLRN